MKERILTFALFVALGAFTFNSYAADYMTTPGISQTEGEHKCDEKCKKDKDGNCVIAADEKKGTKESTKSCCKKGKDSCKDDKGKSKEKKENEPKS